MERDPGPERSAERGLRPDAAADGLPEAAFRVSCRTCWWSAPVTRGKRFVWCAHRVWHGWQCLPLCKGMGYVVDKDL